MATKEELIEKLLLLEDKFENDEEVKSLIQKLENRFNVLQDEVFTPDDYESDEYPDMIEGYYLDLRENDPDDASIFQVLWFK
jgi:uncharacterized protein YfkK (UPF0435 family)